MVIELSGIPTGFARRLAGGFRLLCTVLCAVAILYCGSGSAVAQPGGPATMPLHEWPFDGRYLLGYTQSAPRTYTICLWDTQTGEMIQTYGEAGFPLSAILSRDRRHVVTAVHTIFINMETNDLRSDNSTRVWSRVTGRLVRRVERRDAGLAFTPDERHYISGGLYKTMTDVVTGEDRFVFKGQHVLFTDDSSQAAAIDGGLLTLWDLSKGFEKLRYEAEVGYRIAPTADRQLDRIVLIGPDGSVHVRSLRSGETTYRIPESGLYIEFVQLAKDGKRLTVVHTNGKVDHYDVDDRRLINSFETRTTRSDVRMVSPDDKYFAGMSESGGRRDVRVWELETGNSVARVAFRDPRLQVPLESWSGFRLGSFSDDGRRLVLVDGNRSAAVVVAIPSGAIISEVLLEKIPYDYHLMRHVRMRAGWQ